MRSNCNRQVRPNVRRHTHRFRKMERRSFLCAGFLHPLNRLFYRLTAPGIAYFSKRDAICVERIER